MKYYLWIFAALAVTACATSEANMFGEPFRQYADGVIRFSSQYSTYNWSVYRVLGKEDVYPNYGDNANAWAAKTANTQREFMELSFDSAQTVTQVEIYETYSPGAVYEVALRQMSGEWIVVYDEPAVKPENDEEARIFTIEVEPPVYNVNAVRIDLDCTTIDGWNEIDAVALTGRFPVLRDMEM